MLISEHAMNVRALLFQRFLDDCIPPSIDEISESLGCPSDVVKKSLSALETGRLLKLFPDTHEIKMLLPFSAVPTAFRVESNDRSWWANCAWCALGIPAMLRKSARIFSVCGDCQKPIRWTVESNQVSGTPSIVHFAVGPAYWWDDIAWSCSNILGFCSNDHSLRWCSTNCREQGAVLSRDKSWQLARAVFSDLLQPDWRPKNRDQMSSIFENLGLTGRFWTFSRT
jgi:hypothetical protein